MRYSHAFRVRAPIARVAEFHRHPSSLGLLTPPPLSVRILEAPPSLGSLDLMRFTIGVGPLRLRWSARIEGASDAGFADRQLAGPFASWVHRHRFVAVDAETTEVRDEVTAEPRKHPLWGPLGLTIWAGMPVLFAYRTFQTRRLLQRRGQRT